MGRKADYQGKEGNQPRERRKMTMGRIKDDQGKDDRNIMKRPKESNH